MFIRPQPANTFNLPWGPNRSFEVGGHYYTSLNRSSLPINLPSDTAMPQTPSPTQMRSRLWAEDRFPYLAFLLQDPFVGQWGRFSVPSNPIQDQYGWHLPRDKAKEWKNFEHLIRASADLMSNKLKERFPEFNGLWAEPAKPGLYGYFTSHSTKAEACQAIADSVDAFIVFAAYISFLIALCRSYDASSPRSLRQLFEVSNSKIHPEWVRDLAESPIAQFGPDSRRVGSIVNVKSCKWLNLAPFMIERACVPIWLYWGLPPFSTSNDSWISLYAPPVDEIAHSAPAACPSHSPPSSFPPVHPNSGQLPGETMRAYFKRRKERQMNLIQKESPKNREARLGRERAQARKQLPGKKGPLMFYWEKIGEFNIRIRTLLTRADAKFSWTTWSNKEKVYDSFKNQYDCCSEWSFDPEDNALPNDEREEESTDDEYRYHLSGRPAPPDTAPPDNAPPDTAPPPPDTAPPPPDTALSVESRVTGPAAPLGLPQIDVLMDAPSSGMDSTDGVRSCDTPVSLGLPDVAPSTLQTDVLMVANDETQEVSSLLSDPPVSQMNPSTLQTDVLMVANDEIQEVSSLLSDPPVSQMNPTRLEEVDLSTASKQDILALYPPTPSVQPPPQVQYLEDLVYYRYGYCLSENPYQSRLPAFASDTLKAFESWNHVCNAVGGQGLSSSTNDHAPITDFLVALMYSRRPYHDVPGKYWDLSPGNIRPLKLFTPLHFRIEVKSFRGRQLCLLHPRSETLAADWTIAVGPMTSLECIRRCLGPSSIDVAEFLIKHGISFRTLAPPSTLSSEHGPVKPRQLLGHRSKSHKFDLADFVSYETLRESYLVAQPQGRRALSYGGIVARLARETLPDSVVLAGPSYQALQGQQEIFGEGGDMLVDDKLSEDDLDFICGAYVVETGVKGMHDYSEC
jgi:hypothetical protein